MSTSLTNTGVRSWVVAAGCVGSLLAGCSTSQRLATIPGMLDTNRAHRSIARAAGTFSIIYGFQGTPDGSYPLGVAVDRAGDVFGTAEFGGSLGYGAVFELVATGSSYSETILHNFDPNEDGAYPQGAPLELPDGRLFVATEGSPNSCGAISELRSTANGYRETGLSQFNCTDGAPQPPLKVGDLLYLGTNISATNGGGTIATLSLPKLTQTIVYDSFGGQGVSPNSPLTTDPSGAIYGTAANLNGPGILFRFVPAGSGGTESAIWQFQRGGGQSPSGGVTIDKAGNIYGTTQSAGRYGFGLVYKLTPNGSGGYSETILHEFAGGSDGSMPAAGVVFEKGALYGTTTFGGTGECESGCGTFFKVSTDGSRYAIVHAFQGNDGAFPASNLAVKNGTIYGTTTHGGLYGDGIEGNGIVFSYVP